jgi:cytochrome c biogenesis protein CcmG/thiol:disulfide interchange protein DsbE
MSRFKLFLPLIVFVLLAGLFYFVQNNIKQGSYDPQAMPSALVGQPLPDFKLPLLIPTENSTTASLSDLPKGWLLVNVWATWCPSCHYEHAYLNQLAARNIVKIIGVDYKDDNVAAQKWLQDKGNPYALVVADQQGHLGLDLGVTGAPENFLVDPQGVVRLRWQGPLDEQVWQAQFAPLIKAGQM